MGESFQKLNLTNAYLFAAAMQDEEICRNVLEIALNKRISRVKAHVEQVLFLDSEFKSVRFDVYASDEEEVSYDVEMQNDDTKNLPKRCRYYQAELDVTSLRPGEDYQQLKPGYIIFICSFDPFGKGRCQYVFEEYCKEADIPLGDETQKIFFNTNGTDTQNSLKRAEQMTAAHADIAGDILHGDGVGIIRGDVLNAFLYIAVRGILASGVRGAVHEQGEHGIETSRHLHRVLEFVAARIVDV